ncbi:MAG: hypothetical protein R3C97_11815 [Geminicoccaceae bacterium]
MQIFYLLPPAALLWTQFGTANNPGVLVVPVLVMATGQLAGGLAWLTVSGEDAPDLIATAPLQRGRVLRAKIEAVAGAVSLLALPIIACSRCNRRASALIALVTVMIACASATAIQPVPRSGQAQPFPLSPDNLPHRRPLRGRRHHLARRRWWHVGVRHCCRHPPGSVRGHFVLVAWWLSLRATTDRLERRKALATA